jgi:hypothetical protein
MDGWMEVWQRKERGLGPHLIVDDAVSKQCRLAHLPPFLNACCLCLDTFHHHGVRSAQHRSETLVTKCLDGLVNDVCCVDAQRVRCATSLFVDLVEDKRCRIVYPSVCLIHLARA